MAFPVIQSSPQSCSKHMKALSKTYHTLFFTSKALQVCMISYYHSSISLYWNSHKNANFRHKIQKEHRTKKDCNRNLAFCDLRKVYSPGTSSHNKLYCAIRQVRTRKYLGLCISHHLVLLSSIYDFLATDVP